MKYLKTYGQLNEGLRHKMVGKSDRDIMKSYEKLDVPKLRDILDNMWVKYIHDAYTNPEYFSMYVKGVIGRDLLKEIEEHYKNTISDEKMFYFLMKYLSPFVMISELELSKEEIIKIIIQLHHDYN